MNLRITTPIPIAPTIRCPDLKGTIPARCQHAVAERSAQKEYEDSKGQRYLKALRKWMSANNGYHLRAWQERWLLQAFRYH